MNQTALQMEYRVQTIETGGGIGLQKDISDGPPLPQGLAGGHHDKYSKCTDIVMQISCVVCAKYV